jgi:hypothetical protein
MMPLNTKQVLLLQPTSQYVGSHHNMYSHIVLLSEDVDVGWTWLLSSSVHSTHALYQGIYSSWFGESLLKI